MKTFSQFLSEGRDAPLYRGMMLDHLVWDLSDNVMKARTEHFIVPIKGYHTVSMADRQSKLRMGISTTRSYSFAKGWAQETHNMHQGHIDRPDKLTVPCVVEFDQRVLAYRNKIIPYNFIAMVGGDAAARDETNQIEEFVIGDIKPLRPVVKKIWLWGNMREREIAIRQIRYKRGVDVLADIPMEYR